MKLFFILIAFVGVYNLSSCKKVDANKGDKSNFNFSASNFDGINLKGSMNIHYSNIDTSLLYVNTTQEVFDIMTFEVVDNILEIGILDGYNLKNSEYINVYISKSMVNNLIISGSGNIEAELNSEAYSSFSTQVSGSGNITVQNIVSTSTTGLISGSGNLSLNGTSDSGNLTISGSGNISSYALITDNSYANISGSGNIYLTANSSLNANISGSGNISYKGAPTITQNISGSGNIINAN